MTRRKSKIVVLFAACALVPAGLSSAQCSSGGSSGGPGGELRPPPPPPPPRFAPSDVVAPRPSSPSTPSPSGPSTPSSPSTPGPGGPTTQAPAAPGAGAAPFTPRGTPIVFARSVASKQLLEICWDYPVPADGAQAMAFEQALATVRGDDLRPLIVLRECYFCDDADLALLNRTKDNEKTMLLTRWFHCVKLTDHVRHPEHPFHGLFEGDHAPHLFVSDWAGDEVYPFDGAQRQADLWKTMFKVLRKEYRHDATVAVKKLSGLLEDLDRLDGLERTLLEQHDRALEEQGPDSARLRKIAQKLDGVRRQIEEVKAREKMIADLGLEREKAAMARAGESR